MNEATLSDDQYEEDLRTAEWEFLKAHTAWRKLLTKEVRRIPRTQIPHAAALISDAPAGPTGESLAIESRPYAQPDLVRPLAKMCRRFATSELQAYADLLCRSRIAHSQALDKLEEHAKLTIAKTQRRKWAPAVRSILECFDLRSPAEDRWRTVVDIGIWGFVREILEPYLLAQAERLQATGQEEAAKHTNASAKSSLQPDMEDQREPSRPGARKVDPIAKGRRLLWNDFKSRALVQGIKINHRMLAKAAKSTWNDRTMVTWWLRNDPGCKPQHDKLIRAVLAKDPQSLCPSKSQN